MMMGEEMKCSVGRHGSEGSEYRAEDRRSYKWVYRGIKNGSELDKNIRLLDPLFLSRIHPVLQTEGIQDPALFCFWDGQTFSAVLERRPEHFVPLTSGVRDLIAVSLIVHKESDEA